MSEMEPAAAAPASGYPLRFDVEYQEEHSRLLIFIKWLLAIPHFIILYLLGLIAYIITIIAFFVILFTAKYPRGMFDFMVNYQRWNANVIAYLLLLRDDYPPFSWETGQYPVQYEVDYPEQMNRWLPLIKWLLIIPNAIVMLIVLIVAYLLVIIAWLVILFTGKLPRGMFDFIVGAMRWNLRVNVYIYLMRDEYPPFSMK